MKGSYIYKGNELSLFQNACNWKKYLFLQLKPYIKGSVVEAGAGLGANVKWFISNAISEITLLEPDETMSKALKEKLANNNQVRKYTIVNGQINDLSGRLFDTILYVDVLEHIQDDREELKKAASLLKPGGHLLVLSPAFQSLYSSFDKTIGHFRRYSKKQLRKITPSQLIPVKLYYLDTCGFFASWTNRMLLKQSYPTAKQVYLWDKWMIPVSRITDKLFFHSFGKSIVAVWQKTPDKHAK